MRKEAKTPKRARIDRKHRFPLRVDEVDHNEIDALAFRQNVSLNVAYCEAIKWALDSDGFLTHMQEKFPRDERRGHFVFHADERTVRRGREL